MSKPIAVLISDVHYNLQTLPLADAAMRQAITEANSLKVPLIVAGDLHDTKANLRGECVNAMLETFRLCVRKPYILIGNHDRINEKSYEHSLNFLGPLDVEIVTERFLTHGENMLTLLPYHHDLDLLRSNLSDIPEGEIVIMHQGLVGSNMGEYVQDKSAITKNDVAGLRIISGHYHDRQTIDLPNGGKWDYIGNPYSLSFGEAHDPDKGFQVLHSDGSLEFIPTSLRKHIIVTINNEGLMCSKPLDYKDIVWVKCHTKQSRQDIQELLGVESFKLTYENVPIAGQHESKSGTQQEQLDALIDGQALSVEEKARLKQTWRDLCE